LDKKSAKYVKVAGAYYEIREKANYHLVHTPEMTECPVCMDEGRRSVLQLKGCTETLMGVAVYYDQGGRYHIHNPNRRTTKYVCSRGHYVYCEEEESPRCPAGCGWTYMSSSVI